MRLILVLALGAVLGGGLWLVFGRRPTEPSRVPGSPNGEDDPTVELWMRHKAGVLTIRVHAPDGSVPPGAQAGYDTPQGPRLYFVDAKGVKTLTDVPLGSVTVLAQAPGFVAARRPARVEAGVTEEVPVELTPEPAAVPR